ILCGEVAKQKILQDERLRCISRIDSYLFKVEVAKKLKMKVTFVDCVCVNLQSREVVVVEKTARGRGVYESCDFVGWRRAQEKALEKARIEWESAKTVVEELQQKEWWEWICSEMHIIEWSSVIFYMLSLEAGMNSDEERLKEVEWRRGLKALRADTLAKLKKATSELQYEVDGVGLGSWFSGLVPLVCSVGGFKPFFENLQSICNGVYFARVGELFMVFEAATFNLFRTLRFIR
ncbi:hypothetical protein Tco_0808011, partial [Tanacetum coccineum]